MAYGFTNAGGGGGSTGPLKKGTIVVSYPAGATCTVSNGSKTYTALDTSGAAAFSVDAGTWTVRAYGADGDISESVSVAAGGWVSVEIVFVTYIFKEGSGALVPMTVNSKASIGDDYISMYLGGTGAAGKAYTTSKFDLTDINTLWAEGEFTGGTASSNYRTGIFVHSAILGDNAGPHEGTAWSYFPVDSTRQIISLDVSGISGSYYIGFHGKSVGEIYNFYYK